MKQTFHDKLRSPWVPIGFVVGVVALCAGLIYGMAGLPDITADDEWTPPTPLPPQETPLPVLQVLETIAAGPPTATAQPRPRATSTPISKAHAEYLAASPGKALYFSAIDKVLHLPDSVVYVVSWGPGGATCAHDKYCPVLPMHELGNIDQKRVKIDDAGTILSEEYHSAFPFLDNVPFLVKVEDR